MLAELVKTETRDELRLDGALHTPAPDQPPQLALDAVVLLHGVASNFYGGRLFSDLAPRMLRVGLAVLRVNTRGHDAFSWAESAGGATRQGAAYEVVDHCRHDVTAWADFLAARGYSRIGLLGHSLGAIKAIYSQAFAPHDAVQCILAASPPRLSYAAFQHGPRSASFFESIITARQHVKEGRSEALFQARFPFPLLISAATYLDKYGPDERYNILRFLDRVGCPTLFVYGQQELEQGGVAFAGLDQAVPSAAAPGQPVGVATVAGADHFYTGCSRQLGDELVGWLEQEFGNR